MNSKEKRRDFLKKLMFYTCVTYVSILIINNSHTTKEQERPFVHTDYVSMGTNGDIQIFPEGQINGETIIEDTIIRLNQFEKFLSKFKPDSDIGLLNSNPYYYRKVSNETLTILDLSIKYNKMTNGYFDIGLGNFLSISGIDPNVPVVGKNFFLKNNFKTKLLDIKNNKVKLLRSNSMIDLGGIAKGYALDEAMKILIKNGIKHAAIEFGGDIKVYGGMPNNKPWKIIINTGNKNEIIKIKNGSIAITGGYIKKSKNNINNISHHIIDPKTLTSKNYYSSILVMGKDSVTCDALATAAYNMQKKDIINLKKIFKNYEFKFFY